MAQSDIATHEFVPPCADIEIAAKTGFDDMVTSNRAERSPLFGLVEAIINIVVLCLYAYCHIGILAVDVGMPGVARVQTTGDAFIRLAKLITVDRIVHEVGEVLEQIELALYEVGTDLTRLVAIGTTPSSG